MGQQDCRPDPVEQACEAARVHVFGLGQIGRQWAVAGIELVHRFGVARSKRPLRVQVPRVGREVDLAAALIGERRSHRPYNVGMQWRAAVARAVNDDGGISRLDQPLRPARSPIRRVEPLGALEPAAMQQHDGVRARNPLGCLPFGKHRPALIGLAVARDSSPTIQKWPRWTVRAAVAAQNGRALLAASWVIGRFPRSRGRRARSSKMAETRRCARRARARPASSASRASRPRRASG